MARKKSLHQCCALVFQDDALLFVRKNGEEKFHLPSLCPAPLGKKRALAKALYADYGFEGTFVRRLPELVEYFPWGGLLVHAYVYSMDFPERIVGYEYAFIPEGDPRLNDIEESSVRLAKRAYLYAPLYQERPRTVPLLPEDDKKAYWELRCLRYFHRRIPSAEIEEFEALIYSASSMRRINAAFAGICNAYQANPNSFIAHLEYREKRRKALQ